MRFDGFIRKYRKKKPSYFSIPLRFTLNIIPRMGDMKEIIFPIIRVSSDLNLVQGQHYSLLPVHACAYFIFFMCWTQRMCLHYKDDAISFKKAMRIKESLDEKRNIIIRHNI